VLGSLNWNDHSARENREVVVALEGEEPAGYYERVFRGDWRAAVWRLTIGLVAVVLVAVTVAILVGRRVEFGGESTTGVDAMARSENVDAAIEDGF